MKDSIDTEKDCDYGEKQFRRFLTITVVIIVCLLLALFLLFADRYNWLDFLIAPINSMMRFIRRNLTNITLGFFGVAILFAFIALEIASAKYANKKCAEIERNVSGSIPIPLNDFIYDWNSLPSNHKRNALYDLSQYGYKYVYLSGIYVIAEHNAEAQRLVPIFVGSSFVGACCSRAYARLSGFTDKAPYGRSTVGTGKDIYIVFIPCQKEFASEVKADITSYLAEAYAHFPDSGK